MSVSRNAPAMPGRRRFLRACAAAAGCAALGNGAYSAVPDGSSGDTYGGMHDGAAWRHAALERIERQRKKDFSLLVTDAAGNGLEGADVSMELYRHEFGFGGGVRLPRFFDSAFPVELRERYKATAAAQFHKVVAVNALKWKHIDNSDRLVGEFLGWSEAEDLPVRGHTLVWPRFRRAPGPVAALAGSPDALRAAIREHIVRMAGDYRGRIAEWDVLNEPYSEHEYMDILGNEAAIDWFCVTRDTDPDAKRYINDFGILTRPNAKHRDFYFDYIRWLLERGAPLEGIGFQAHNPAGFALESPEHMLRTLDRFSSFGLDLQVTEFDVERTDRELQARYTMDFMIAVFSHPSIVGLMTWTPFEYDTDYVAKPEAAFFDRDLKPRPNAEVWDLLVNRYWRTRVNGGTSDDGRIGFRGFPGKYRVSISAGGTEQIRVVDFTSGQAHQSISLT